ncbi:DHH family phosphoesterase [Thioalkalivibrio sp. AKL17]|uniref:single-stranded-DNA-specific exonuclease RecJ n=1 Tax=Thioalkalivibrio sp. AKL17 TaxID=1158160 RepID=UPI00037A17D2|nr:DHH family phosphoesterase [Thioalkalivibrio sp. AKL17]
MSSTDPLPDQNLAPPPEPAWVRRRPDPDVEAAARAAGLTPLQARLIAARVSETDPDVLRAGFVERPLRALTPPDALPDLDTAARRILRSLEAGETVALETDHDVDGVTSHALLYRGLTRVLGHPEARLQSWIGHRLREGYGLSDALAERILAARPRPDLVITADNGSGDEARIARLRAAGIDTIVTDHHVIPADGVPASALACVSPARSDSRYGDPAIAGCMVAWLLLMRVHRLRQQDTGREDPAGRTLLIDLLAEVAAGTVADCVTLGDSLNNRVVVHQGLRRMNADDTRPCWRVAARRLTGGERPLDESDLAFGLGPRINARGRLDEAMAGVRFLLAEDEAEAEHWWSLLDEENQNRRRIERELTVRAREEAARAAARGVSGLCLWLPDGHPGVHGIIASRMVEARGLPVLCVSPVWECDRRVTGSARGVPGFHVADAFAAMAAAEPDLLEKHGGHAQAGGLTLARADRERLAHAWERACADSQREHGWTPGPVLEIDGEGPSPRALVAGTLEQIDALAPWGRGFPRPVFVWEGELHGLRRMGDGRHLRLRLETADGDLQGIWFNALEPDARDPWPPGTRIQLAGSPEWNHYNGTSRLQVRIHAARSAAVGRKP